MTWVKKRFWVALFMAFASCVSVAHAEMPDVLSDLEEVFSGDQTPGQRSILESLALSGGQKAEIQNILLAGMQSLDAVNAQIGHFEASFSTARSADAQQMLTDLKQQRIQLAEMMSVEILSILTPVQRSKLNLTSNLPARAEEPSPREYEI